MRQVVVASSTIHDRGSGRTLRTRFAEAQIQDLEREGASRSLHSQHSELASPVPHSGPVTPVKPHSDSMPTTAPGANPPPTSSIAPRASLPSTTRKPRRRRQKAAKEKLYAIRGILREEYRGGKLWYEIDWDNDPNTGQQYPPSWVCFKSSCLSRHRAPRPQPLLVLLLCNPVLTCDLIQRNLLGTRPLRLSKSGRPVNKESRRQSPRHPPPRQIATRPKTRCPAWARRRSDHLERLILSPRILDRASASERTPPISHLLLSTEPQSHPLRSALPTSPLNYKLLVT